MTTITVCSIVKDEEFFIDMMIKSALEFADEMVIIVDSKTTDKTIGVIKSFDDKRIKMFELDYGEKFSDARQLAQDKATSDWVFYLDADEVLHENITCKMKDIVKELDSKGVDACHVQYTHFINDFCHIDNSEVIHYGMYRLYRRDANAKYIRHIHSLPQAAWKKITVVTSINIFHLGYIRGMEKIFERFYRNYTNPADYHFPFHQVNWRHWHYTGEYPTKKFNINLIPKVIKDKFMIEVFDK